METDHAVTTPAPWRSTAALALTMALLVLGVAVAVRYRHDHRDAWVTGTVAWRGFDVSEDGRTLTFHGWGSAPCIEPTGVSFSSDPTHGGEVTALLETRRQSVRDGHDLFCPASLQIDTPIRTVTFDHAVPDGTIITDGVPGDLPGDLVDPMFCGRPQTQVVRSPTTIGPTLTCTLAG